MKQIVNKVLVDTETSELLAYYSNGNDCGNFHWFEERLYLSKIGQFFLHGEGHGCSPYGWHFDNMSGMGEKLVPLSADEVLGWLENRQITDNLEYIYDLVCRQQNEAEYAEEMD